jgi:lysophospholipase L1-like esterase
LTVFVLILSITLMASPMNQIPHGSPPVTDEARLEAPIYLALGDSVAVGYGASDPETSGYVALLHETLTKDKSCRDVSPNVCGDLALVNLAEGGATTSSLTDTQLPAALALLEERNSDEGSTNDVSVITITIGGNDAFNALAPVCAEGLTPVCGQVVQRTLATVETNLTQILMQLRAAAGPDTTIVTMTYYNSLLGCDLQAAADNADLILEGLPSITPGLNGIIRQAAARADAAVAETFGQLGADDLIGGEDCLHANDAGYMKIADAFASVLLSEPEPAGYDARPTELRTLLA